MEATSTSISNVVSEGLFVIKDEAITPDEGFYHCSEYDSLDEWVEDHKPSCRDFDAFNAMTVKIVVYPNILNNAWWPTNGATAQGRIRASAPAFCQVSEMLGYRTN